MMNPRSSSAYTIIKRPAYQSRSETFRSVHSANISDHLQKSSNCGCCTSAESSTCSPPHNSMQEMAEAHCLPDLVFSAPNYEEAVAAETNRARRKAFGSLNHVKKEESHISSDFEAKISSDLSGVTVAEGVLCSMCGDVGIAELLFVCSRCCHRYQHMYCSRSYPNIGEEAYMCNWCLHEQDSMLSSTSKVSNTQTTAKGKNEFGQSVGSNTGVYQTELLHAHRNLRCLLGSPAIAEDENDESNSGAVMGKGHTKAFEYLLLVAAQSLPNDNREMSGVDIPGSKQNNVMQSMFAASKFKESSGARKMASSPDAIKADKLDVTPLATMLSRASEREFARLGTTTNENFHVALERNRNERTQNQAKLDGDKKSVDIDRLIGGGIPKRQRGSKGISSPLKCRKKSFQCSPSRPNYRRYKLLADVVC
ncbi:hypothetical protein KP509_05G056500 [Ceratopteris richardii]|uniref:PHD-type zinc finger plants domain-containing protein n=1 Tax=Ceratopteris richardii TaxID=49495 RepID=A0A8T2UYI3_CERRI|nr:hypothetical protein KP509_05G056500 [Ceratopteris richardii]